MCHVNAGLQVLAKTTNALFAHQREGPSSQRSMRRTSRHHSSLKAQTREIWDRSASPVSRVIAAGQGDKAESEGEKKSQARTARYTLDIQYTTLWYTVMGVAGRVVVIICCFSHSAYWLPTRKNYLTWWPILLVVC